MIIELTNWRIQSYQYGYQLERRINPIRWKAERYYPDLPMAIESLLDQRMQTETDEFNIQLEDPAAAYSCMMKLVSAVKVIAAELKEGVRNVH